MSKPHTSEFDATWEYLAARGSCDARGGMEYTRVRREWNEAGRPHAIGAFIRRRANIGPDGK